MSESMEIKIDEDDPFIRQMLEKEAIIIKRR